MQTTDKLYQNLRPNHPGSIGPRRRGRQARYSFVKADGSRGWHVKAFDHTKLSEQDVKSLIGQR